jgi:hypothetical protein
VAGRGHVTTDYKENMRTIARKKRRHFKNSLHLKLGIVTHACRPSYVGGTVRRTEACGLPRKK